MQDQERCDADLRYIVLKMATEAAKNNTGVNMSAQGKQYTPKESALAVVEAYRAAVKALDAPESPTSHQEP